MSQSGSQGSRVPRPTLRVQAQSFSQPIVRSNSVRTSGGTRVIWARCSETCDFHAGSLYSRNHWSWRILTNTCPPHLHTTGLVSNSYITVERYFSHISAATLSLACLTGSPPYCSKRIPEENSAL
ncbi:MAG: hypothetical protein A4E40_00701 [Methanoregulaceae archaeon PtaU1.Bin059]|nr:MAG: hypothetical protein A4E40_00701 [Methanoregulaceae archaeon PtaU1.Bin059]